MSQNLIHLALDDAQLAAIDQALSTLETTLAGLISLDAEDRRSLARLAHFGYQDFRCRLGGRGEGALDTTSVQI